MKKLIGIFATEISSRVQSNLYRELNKKASERGYTLVLFSGTNDQMVVNKTTMLSINLYNLAENVEFAAFIIHTQSIGDPDLIHHLIEMGKRKNIPVFAFDCEPQGISCADGVIAINNDYKTGFAEVVRHLIEDHDCKNIFMLAGIKDNKYSDDRIAMYRQEMEAHGIPYSENQIGYGDFWDGPATIAVEKFLDSDLPIPDAICCANDTMAITTTRVLTQRGYKVPEDVLVTGFDGIEDGKYNMPMISTSEPKLDEVAEFVFDSIEGKNLSRDYLIQFQFDEKESCGCNSHNNMEDRYEIAKLVDNYSRSSWMEHELSIMQVELIDCEVISASVGYMEYALRMFENYTSVFCIRDDIEALPDYTESLDKMRIHFNNRFMPLKEYGTFSVDEVLPDWNNILENALPEEMFCLRLIHCDNKIYGYEIVKTSKYTSSDIKMLGQFTDKFTYVVESILRNKRLNQATKKLSEMYDRMSEIYIRDTMTGLYNRHGYYQEMEEYINRDNLKQGYLQIISIDMDGMKYINDNFGHMEGDNAIKAVAKAINECFSQPCISARFGGDEFVVALFTEEENEPTVEKISLRLNDYLKTVSLLVDKEYTVGVSVGRAVAKLSDIKDIKSLEKNADDQMYINKRHRKEKNTQKNYKA